MAKPRKYTVSIAFNYGRDEASRVVVSTHNSPRAALRAWKSSCRVNRSNGWATRVECCDDKASALLINEDLQWVNAHWHNLTTAR